MSGMHAGTSYYREGDGRHVDASPASSLLSTNQVVFCVNPVLFMNCGIMLDAPSGLTTSAIMKIRQESPNCSAISLALWRDIAVNVIGLREVVAYSIFDVVYALTGSFVQTPLAVQANGNAAHVKSVAEYRQEGNRALLKKMGGSLDETRWPSASSSRQVSLPALTIFLFAQLLLEHPPQAMLGDISQELIMSSVRQHLHDYITAVAVTRPGRLTVADAQELKILLREFVNGVELPFGTSIGFLWPRSERTIDITILSQFIRPRIMLPSELAATTTGSPFSNNLLVRGLRGTIYIPPCPVMSTNAAKLMVSSNYTIEKCSQSSLYITSDLPHTRLSQLVNCTVAIGPVSGVLCVDRCENCNISALCAAIVVSHCKNVTIFVCTNTPPVISVHNGDSTLKNVRFAPYNSHYSTLEEHLASSGINPKLNLWNVGLPTPHYVLPPDDFTPICFPVAPHPSAVITTRTNPCPLPRLYAEALERRVQRFQDTSTQLQETYQRLESEGRKDLAEKLRGRVHTMFMEWLRRTGQEKGLISLLHQGTENIS
ncbi:putative tubulin binding cofactor c [Trypanosoma rangeli]|uniref:Putative tubulin binding cofactor c n=1 Tax=Trypanosoma rangeli TaxID=5698 RepID=A0A3R7M8R7_TRYRA|nr:putative tubulin binding cofactor c [Trypanosoma rangeli]RNF11095.1 putative tubulin binding cofactor c [Trypanosoma rangeli]|eukprot:RNF11095.1 putative tubulin binding cofactor c [Trypanosoma rangeli]